MRFSSTRKQLSRVVCFRGVGSHRLPPRFRFAILSRFDGQSGPMIQSQCCYYGLAYGYD